MYETVFVAYKSTRYDLNGNWNGHSKRTHLWFPLVNLEPEQITNFAEECDVRLLKRLRPLLVKPTAELVISDEIIMPDADHYVYDPPVYASELTTTEQGESGLAVVSGKYTADMAQYALKRCGLIIENIYSDHLLERIES